MGLTKIPSTECRQKQRPRGKGRQPRQRKGARPRRWPLRFVNFFLNFRLQLHIAACESKNHYCGACFRPLFLHILLSVSEPLIGKWSGFAAILLVTNSSAVEESSERKQTDGSCRDSVTPASYFLAGGRSRGKRNNKLSGFASSRTSNTTNSFVESVTWPGCV